MNPLTNMKNVTKLSEQELKHSNKTSWHEQYRDSAWVFIAGLPYDLTEGDIICILSQYGEIVHVNLVRDKDTGKSRGFGFVCYEDQRSTDLAVDNFNGIKILNRFIRVDHVSNYKVPKSERDKVKNQQEREQQDSEARSVKSDTKKGFALREPIVDARETLADRIEDDIKLPHRLPIYTNVNAIKEEPKEQSEVKEKSSKSKKSKKKHKKKKRKRSSSYSSSSSD